MVHYCRMMNACNMIVYTTHTHTHTHTHITVHELTPADVQVVAALGDSLTVSVNTTTSLANAANCNV